MLELTTGVTLDPSVRFGKPVIRGTRVPVDVIVGRLAAGMSAQAVADEYGITDKDVYNALRYAAQRLTEEQVWVTAA
ncbi:MAG: DUF433 domain-containing protein [Chloroflexi bacterium]|nr:MAG: DUF433 domain-containing protein [Chloroflexota bacterium]